MDKVRQFGGIERLYGGEALDRLGKAHVVVLGVGGVGSWAAEALARSGVGRITLIDPDDICVSNINRQLHALEDTVGHAKVDVLAKRLRAIHPDAKIDAIQDVFDHTWSDAFFLESGADLIIDAIDSVPAKVHLIATCSRLQIPVVVCGGAAGIVDPSRIMVDDLNFSYNDRLLSQVRKRLRWDHDFTGEKVPFGIPAVFSGEKARLADGMCEKEFRKLQGGQGLDCDIGFGTGCFITGSMGFFAAGSGINLLLKGSVR